MNERGGLIWDASAVLALLGREIPTLEADATSRPLITRAQGLSLGDRACLALALRLGLPALTTDRAWVELDVGVAVRAAR